MRIPYTAQITDEALGIDTIYDFECELEIDYENGRFTVANVFKDGKNLYAGSVFSKALSVEITDIADTELAKHGKLYLTVCDLMMNEAA